jgi:uncharacterized protein (TIGR03067 family)
VRPDVFTAAAGSGFVVERLTRGESTMPAIKETEPETAAPGPTEFEGEWRMVSAVMHGQAMEQSAVDWVRRVTRGNQTTVTAGPQVMMKMEFTLDHSQTPKAIDYVNTAGPNKGKAQRGIYKIEGGLLTICTSPPGVPRPAQFESVSGDHRTLTVWKRV